MLNKDISHVTITKAPPEPLNNLIIRESHVINNVFWFFYLKFLVGCTTIITLEDSRDPVTVVPVNQSNLLDCIHIYTSLPREILRFDN